MAESSSQMSEEQSSAASDKQETKRQKTGDSDREDMSAEPVLDSNISIPSLHLSQGHPEPVGHSTPLGSEAGESAPATPGEAAAMSTDAPSDSEQFSDPVLELLKTQAEAINRLKEQRKEQLRPKMPTQKERSVKLYEDPKFPADDYDLTSDENKNLSPMDKMSMGMVSMSYHMDKMIHTYNSMFGVISTLKARSAEQSIDPEQDSEAQGAETEQLAEKNEGELAQKEETHSMIVSRGDGSQSIVGTGEGLSGAGNEPGEVEIAGAREGTSAAGKGPDEDTITGAREGASDAGKGPRADETN